MKRTLFIVLLVFCSFRLMAQENRFTLSGGYVFTNVEDVDANATGFRINGLYEFNPAEGIMAHGFNFGYFRTTASHTVTGQTNNYTITNLPFYYAPKVLIGKGSFKGFFKGALGFHYSNFKRTGSLVEIDTWDFGFYGGASAGIEKRFNDKIFINVEYEWAYLSNSSFRDGFVNSVMGGVGFRF